MSTIHDRDDSCIGQIFLCGSIMYGWQVGPNCGSSNCGGRLCTVL